MNAPRRLSFVVTIALSLAGCSADDPFNPSFPLSLSEARDEWERMSEAPLPFERPVVVLGGIYDPGLVSSALVRNLREIAEPGAEMLSVSFLLTRDFDACRKRLLDAIDDTWPTDDPERTTEVDVVAVSMGGLVARYAARPVPGHDRRLHIHRLFTIATPHLGARMATLPTLDARVLDMRAGSEFLRELDEDPGPDAPEIFPYTRLDDAIVGPERTAPRGRTTWWVANMPFAFAHLSVAHDPRILADIARRLRGELPYTREPPAPLPGEPGTPPPP